jgi:heat shock protein HtpX
MEMCVDNPRQGFADLFATHPPIDKRIEALVKFAGGHDPGPLQLAPPEEGGDTESGDPESGGPWGPGDAPAGGPWGDHPGQEGGASGGAKPFLPQRPPIELGGSTGDDAAGPWGPQRRG